MPRILYHYTDANGYAGIMPTDGSQGVLLASTSQTSKDAYYGDGWYLTDLKPYGTDRTKMARDLWDGSYARNFQKTEFYIAFEFHGNTRIIECRSHVFFIPLSSNPRPNVVEHGPFPPITTIPPVPADTPQVNVHPKSNQTQQRPVGNIDPYPHVDSNRNDDRYVGTASDPTRARSFPPAAPKPSLWRRFVRWLSD